MSVLDCVDVQWECLFLGFCATGLFFSFLLGLRVIGGDFFVVDVGGVTVVVWEGTLGVGYVWDEFYRDVDAAESDGFPVARFVL